MNNNCNATEDKIKLAGDDAKDRLYEPKHKNSRGVRILTVIAYVFCVSLAAIMLSLYYVFLWHGTTKPLFHQRIANCDKVVVPENMAIRLVNSTEITADSFFKTLFRRYQTNSSIQIGQSKEVMAPRVPLHSTDTLVPLFEKRKKPVVAVVGNQQIQIKSIQLKSRVSNSSKGDNDNEDRDTDTEPEEDEEEENETGNSVMNSGNDDYNEFEASGSRMNGNGTKTTAEDNDDNDDDSDDGDDGEDENV